MGSAKCPQKYPMPGDPFSSLILAANQDIIAALKTSQRHGHRQDNTAKIPFSTRGLIDRVRGFNLGVRGKNYRRSI